jgi:hypothetical protein
LLDSASHWGSRFAPAVGFLGGIAWVLRSPERAVKRDQRRVSDIRVMRAAL